MTGTDLSIATLGGHSMGTTWCVKVAITRHHDLHALHATVQDALDRVVRAMSTWDSASDISRYNRAPAATWHLLPVGFAEVAAAALHIAEASGGAFDPTIGPLVALWGFGATGGPPRVPSLAERTRAQQHCGWRRLRLRGQHLLQPGGLMLDLSGIAKGYGVDCVQRALRTAQIPAALIEVGGELFGYGRKPDTSAWQVLVESAPEEETDAALPARVLALDNLAVATSGDRWHRFAVDGACYTHTFDPRLGRPVPQAPAAVTVVAEDAMHADAWATAMTVLGATAGLRHAAAAGLAVRFLSRTGTTLTEQMSPAFKRLLDTA